MTKSKKEVAKVAYDLGFSYEQELVLLEVSEQLVLAHVGHCLGV